MNFYYDPILGLQYSNTSFFILLDIEKIPENLTIPEVLYLFMQKGLVFSEVSLDVEVKCGITVYNL